MTEDLDLSDTIEPRSDQMNAEDLLSGPRTFTIARVRKTGGADQPVDIYLEEFPASRPFKPSKTVRRLLIVAWGADGSLWAGRRMTLYRDPDVRFGGEAVGGIRVSHLSHIPRRVSVSLSVTRGRRAPYHVDPLPKDAEPARAVGVDTTAELLALFERKGIPEAAQLQGVNRITGGSATALEVLTEDQARRVIAALQQRPDVEPAAEPDPGEAYDPTVEPGFGEDR